MSRRAGPACESLRRAIGAGVSGTYRALAEAAGLAPDKARATLKEMRRRGEACCSGGTVYGAAAPTFDALAHVRQVWR